MPNRYYCDVLQEIRDIIPTLNFTMLPSLIEELQVYGSRMEAALHDKAELHGYHEQAKRLKKEIKKLEETYESLKADNESQLQKKEAKDV